jgi:hypothetical protein
VGKADDGPTDSTEGHKRRQDASGQDDPGKNVDLQRLTKWEHHAVWICITVTAALLGLIVFLIIIEPGLAWPLLFFMVFNLILGREISIAAGSAMGLPPWLMLVVNVTQSVSMGLLVYLGSVHVLVHRPDTLLGRGAREIQNRADRHRGTIDRFGPPGLFLLMLMPFFAHPFIGAMSGRLSGLSLKQMIIPILAATTVMATIWAYSMTALIGVLQGIWEGFSILIVAVFIVTGGIVSFTLYRKKKKDDLPGSGSTA